MKNINSLPSEISCNRILDSAQASEFIGLSLPHFRRMYRTKKVPSPIKIGERKYGWRVFDLVDWLEHRAKDSDPQ